MCRSRLALLTLLGIFGDARTPAQELPAVDRVSWLQGCWASISPQRSIEEMWMAPRGGAMLGMSRTVRGGTLAEYELVVLREDAGKLVYHAHPSGQASAAFPVKEMSDRSVLSRTCSTISRSAWAIGSTQAARCWRGSRVS
jgi:hypothetical protein